MPAKKKGSVIVSVKGGSLSIQCSRKVQAKQFEPIEAHASINMDFEVFINAMNEEERDSLLQSPEFNEFAEELGDFVIYHTETTLAKALENV